MRARARFYVAAALTTAINAVQILDGRATAKAIRAELGAEVASIQKTHGVTPGLGVLLVGDRRDSGTYVRRKGSGADGVSAATPRANAGAGDKNAKKKAPAGALAS